jgi:hypothetical protein
VIPNITDFVEVFRGMSNGERAQLCNGLMMLNAAVGQSDDFNDQAMAKIVVPIMVARRRLTGEAETCCGSNNQCGVKSSPDIKAGMMVDPPSGHQYGFPRKFTPRYAGQDVQEWLREQGVPEHILAIGHIRCWETPEPPPLKLAQET